MRYQMEYIFGWVSSFNFGFHLVAQQVEPVGDAGKIIFWTLFFEIYKALD